MVMSQNIRAEYTRPPSASQGSTWNVDGSGRATMSDRRPIEPDALVERALQLRRGHRDVLEEAEHVGEPEPNETDVPLFQGAQDELLLPIHVAHLM
jgi:hypothetical protein